MTNPTETPRPDYASSRSADAASSDDASTEELPADAVPTEPAPTDAAPADRRSDHPATTEALSAEATYGPADATIASTQKAATSEDGPAPPPAGSRRAKLLLTGAAGLVVALLAGGVAFFTLGGGGSGSGEAANSDQAQIKRLVNNFADSIDRQDQRTMLSLMCAEEAADVTDSDGFDPNATGTSTVPPDQKTKLTTSDVRIVGDMATARITREDRTADQLYFLKENSQWKVCAPVADRLGMSPSVSPSASPQG